jgi:uncharacterized damage-inducible protein DinB
MLTSEALLAIHERAHRNLRGYLAFCRTLDPPDMERRPELGGISIRIELHHAINAERYWIGVLEGRLDVEEDAQQHPTILSLDEYREATFAATRAYLAAASTDELNSPRPMMVDPGIEETYVPGHIIVRTITHLYHHQGRIALALRVLGSPLPETLEDTDYPITP